MTGLHPVLHTPPSEHTHTHTHSCFQLSVTHIFDKLFNYCLSLLVNHLTSEPLTFSTETLMCWLAPCMVANAIIVC